MCAESPKARRVRATKAPGAAQKPKHQLEHVVDHAIADMVGREYVPAELWHVTVPLPPPPPAEQARQELLRATRTESERLAHQRRVAARRRPPCKGAPAGRRAKSSWKGVARSAAREVTLEVRVVGERVELDEIDPGRDTLNRDAWNRIQSAYGRAVSLRLDQGRPVVEQADGQQIAGQRVSRYGTRSQLSVGDMLLRLERCTYPPELSDDELTRLRAHLEAAEVVGQDPGDPAARARLEKLKAIMAHNVALRRGRASAAVEPQRGSQPSKRFEMMRRIVEAMLLVHDNPGRSNRAIATLVGVSPGTLSRNQLFQRAAAQARAGQALNRGCLLRDADTHQTDVEAYSNDDETEC